MADLAATIAQRIGREGPLSLAAFMAMALHDPEGGYYARHDPLGRAGDFITAPEISQIFGELIGLWCADMWRRIGRPDPVILAELGPGRGTLMADFLRAAATLPEFRRALRLHLVEASARLRAAQQRRLAAADPRFVASLDALPPGPLLLVANEFLDALPIRQLVRGPAEWRERLVGARRCRSPRLCRRPGKPGPEPPGAGIAARRAHRCDRRDLPGRLGARRDARRAAGAISRRGVADRLRAISRAEPARPWPRCGGTGRPPSLDGPGSADLSAHVDFAAVAAAAGAAGAEVYGPVPQGQFLAALGAEARLAALSARADPTTQIELAGGLERLIDPAQMGNLFKVLALTSPGLPAPAGFT